MFRDDDELALPLALKKKAKTGTLSKPSRTDTIMSCSKVLHQHIWRAAQADRKPGLNQNIYDIDKFLKPQLNVRLPLTSTLPFFSAVNQTPKIIIVPDLPDESKIFRFCKRVVDRCHLNAECVIIALIYIERLMENMSINIRSHFLKGSDHISCALLEFMHLLFICVPLKIAIKTGFQSLWSHF